LSVYETGTFWRIKPKIEGKRGDYVNKMVRDLTVLLVVFSLVLSACGGTGGTNDPAYNWVTAFEKETNCKVTVKDAATSDEMVTLMNQGGFALVTASGDASLRLIAGGNVQPCVRQTLAWAFHFRFGRLSLVTPRFAWSQFITMFWRVSAGRVTL